MSAETFEFINDFAELDIIECTPCSASRLLAITVMAFSASSRARRMVFSADDVTEEVFEIDNRP